MNVFFKTFASNGTKTLASPFWWARFAHKGKRRAIKLARIAGKPPRSLVPGDKGDSAFEQSRLRAEAQAIRVTEDLRGKLDQAALLTRIRELHTGRKLATIPLQKMVFHWEEGKELKESPNSESYEDQSQSKIEKFLSFLAAQNPVPHEMADVTKELAEEYMRTVQKSGVSGKTFNDTLSLLKTAFELLKSKAGLIENPFDGLKRKKKNTVGRVAFTVDELARILSVVDRPEHAFIRPLVICGFCTAMRRGDCALLEWASVDLESRHITVKTHKTGITVSVPLFPLLEAEIRRRLPQRGTYIFPEQAMMYQCNPDGISYRVEKVLRDAGFAESDLRVKRDVGVRRVNVRGMHAFRVTWATLALNAGVSPEIVRKVTGHQTLEILLSVYYKPARDDFRRALTERMPKIFALEEGNPTTDKSRPS